VDDERVTGIDERDRKARAHLFSGVAALVIAVVAVPTFGWLAALAMAVVGVGNLLARRDVRRDGEMTPTARALMIVGGLGFAVVCVLLAVRAFAG
jgi:hypothetical protein